MDICSLESQDPKISITLRSKVFHLLMHTCTQSSLSSLCISSKCAMACAWSLRYLGAIWGLLTSRLCVLMNAMGSDGSTLIINGSFSLIALYFLPISLSLFSIWPTSSTPLDLAICIDLCVLILSFSNSKNSGIENFCGIILPPSRKL